MLIQEMDPILGFLEVEKRDEFVVSCFAYIKRHDTPAV